MNNYDSPGQVLKLTAPVGDVVSGTAYLVGSILVIAAADATAGDFFEGATVGVFDVPKLDTEAWTEGLKIYFDESAGLFTLDDDTAANPLVGAATSANEPLNISLSSGADPTDLLIVDNTIQVLDFAALADATITITIRGVKIVLTEGVDWTAATDDNTTAADIASAIDALDDVGATATTDTVTVLSGVGRVRLDGVVR